MIDFGLEQLGTDRTWKEKYYWRRKYIDEFGDTELLDIMSRKQHYYLTKNKLFTNLDVIRVGVEDMLKKNTKI